MGSKEHGLFTIPIGCWTCALVGVTSSWVGAGPRVTDAVVLSTFETTSPALPLQWVAAVHWVVGSDQMCGSVRMRCGRGTSKNGEKSRKFTKISDKPRKKKIIIKILEKTRKISNKTLKKVPGKAGKFRKKSEEHKILDKSRTS